ncbi:G2/mitotic-specific cyclin-2-like [Heracleum sosnowskyi]|uniref:G2/mitotic-specific cyclin-2-like n=1 Tax=Heracleum sosnowskyi TaxID=360622 RepID=A0AAD8N8V4_9APIA|nr:G2/mitotic-specific cyclin-2-like [Heracleum sosnowskyi]
MAGGDENTLGGVRPVNSQGGLVAGNGKVGTMIGRTRRALSTINQNFAGGAPYPCANKRPKLPEPSAICNENLQIPVVHRPMTRKLAAQIASKQKQAEEQKDFPIIDVDDYKPKESFPEPMLEEGFMDDEVEMEEADEDLIVDIDSVDKKNPLAVVEYIDDLYAYYKKVESSSCVPPDYMSTQFDINDRMRGILIDWLIEVHYKFELMQETLYLTVNLIDRFLAIQPVIRKKLQLVGITALLLACKYEEVAVPVVEDLIVISDRAYTKSDVLEMETLMVNKLQFNLSVPTAYVFMRRFLKAAQSDNKMELLAFYIIELSLVEYEMLKFPPSLLAAAAVFTAQCTLGKLNQWSKTSERHTSYNEHDLMECSKLMADLHSKAAAGRLTGVYRKYCTSKYGYAAKSEPAYVLLDS